MKMSSPAQTESSGAVILSICRNRRGSRRFSERGQPCPRVASARLGLADKAVRAPSAAAAPRCAVSQCFQPASLAQFGARENCQRSADWKSATQQTEKSALQVPRNLCAKITEFWLCEFRAVFIALACAAAIAQMVLLGPSVAVGATFSLVHSFNETDCFDPNNDGDLIVGLTLGKDGNIYGMAAGGGPASCFNGPYGTIFRVAPDGTFTTLYAFSGPDGAGPGAGDTESIDETGFSLSGGPLVQGADGSLYGTTIGGGQPLDPASTQPRGDGTIFKITPEGALTTLVSFDGTNGSRPVCLLLAKDGNFYGSTAQAPVVFRMGPDGTLTNLVVFDGTNGSGAARSLIQGKDGNFYGTTDGGGAYDRGTVFKMTPSGTLTTLVSFSDTNASPPYSLMQASDGNFYGTMQGGGTYTCVTVNGAQICEYRGTIFKLSPEGTMTNLVFFNDSNGAFPVAALLEGTDGNLYGTTYEGLVGLSVGTLFKMTPQGKLTTLFRFNGPNGYWPTASLIQATDGSFYGTTLLGGANDAGTVFRLTVPGATSPKIVTTSQSGSSLSLTWLALVGRSYQLQFTTNLTETNWFNAGGAITATNTVMATSDNSGPDPQRFYRIVLLP